MRPNDKRAKNAETLILIVTALNVITIVSDYFQYKLLKNAALGLVTTDEAVSNDMRQLILSLLTAACIHRFDCDVHHVVSPCVLQPGSEIRPGKYEFHQRLGFRGMVHSGLFIVQADPADARNLHQRGILCRRRP